MKLSIVSPVYKSEALLSQLVVQICSAAEKITPDFEILLVNDGSPDESWQKIRELSQSNPKVKGINLSKNYGQHAAITAGVAEATGDWIAVLDCDLQVSPEYIFNFHQKATKENLDIVLGVRQKSGDSYYKKTSSRLFYKAFSYLSNLNDEHIYANFSLVSRKVQQAYLELRERHRIYIFSLKWLGFASGTVEVEQQKRPFGRSSYSFRKLFNLALNISLAYSNKPLKLTIGLGCILSGVSFLAGIITLCRYLAGYISYPGYTSIILTLLFLFGLLFVVLGMVGLYIDKIYEEVKGRPYYIISQTTYERL
ncbi:MAG: glycosyltransferase [Flavobacteriaceae bacterium]|nr:glycosyltransferase [Flavobacteriaceae bacterium]